MSHRSGLLLALCTGILMSGCVENTPSSRAYRAESQSQLIGGDVAMARVGDFILENDVIRVAILDVASSPGPGVYGGTLVDADLQRKDAQYRNGSGHDQFAEMFPFANLLAPRPEKDDILIVADGQDGGDAIVRVSGEGAFILDALNVFQEPLLKAFLGDLKLNIRMQTDYILSPGVPYVRIVTEVVRVAVAPGQCGNGVCESESEETEESCPKDCKGPFGLPLCSGEDADLSCAESCPMGLRYDATTGCPLVPCECALDDVVTMENFQDTTSIFFGTLGDGESLLPGMVGGDFVFFGAQNDLFAPGMGFDEDRPIFDGLFEGADPFTSPLTFDFMAAAGGAVSYGYFSANAPGEADPRVLVPIITSSTTAFTTASHNCATDAEGEEAAACQGLSQWRYERFFVVGQGDISSITDVMYEVRGTAVGKLEGTILDALVGPSTNGRVFLLADPDADEAWSDVRDVIAANWKLIGEPGVLNAIDADVGLDPNEDGSFEASLPPGSYLVVATNEAMTATSPVYRVQIEEGVTTRLNPSLPKPASVEYRVTDAHGQLIEAKIVFVPLIDGELAVEDGTRRPALGEGRIGNGIRHMTLTAEGYGEVEIEAGDYRMFVTHGPLYARGEIDISLVPGDRHVAQVTLAKEVDSGDWIGFDAHLHAEPSFDSGMKLERRVISAAAEGLDLAISTDHDVVTNYAPTIGALGLQDRLKSAVGVELSTLELGHFIAFPLDYDALDAPDHNAPEWWCKDGQGIMDELESHFEPGAPGVRIMAHPRDGFIGYISQLEVDPFDMTRADLNRSKVDLASSGDLMALEGGNALLSKATCDYEAMEAFNSKRFDLIRTPTNEEVIVFNQCMRAIEVLEEGDISGLEAICTEHMGETPVAACLTSERFFDCKMRRRRALAKEMTRRILARTPEEQALLWAHRSAPEDADRCDTQRDLATLADDEAQMPCAEFPGVVGDWMRWLDAGLNVTLTAASDSHGTHREPGTPRTWVRHGAVSSASEIDIAKVATAVRDHHAVASYGPVVDATINGKGPGDTVIMGSGDSFTLNLRVQSASWFGVDRIEVYVSGSLQKVIELTHGPEAVIDYDGEIELTAPEQDGFVAVIVMGLRDENLMGPTYLDIPFGELQLPRIASLAFGSLQAFSAFFPPPAAVPDFFPVFPLAMTNAILIDNDGDGWRPAGDGPAFCSRPCDPDADDTGCPGDQTCIAEDAVCGYPMVNMCLPEPTGSGDMARGLVE
ncbi:MAG: PHP domain-containing protein [Myxococcota bacterium]